jgi:uncharacterized protein YjiS (DUF1127 family)
LGEEEDMPLRALPAPHRRRASPLLRARRIAALLAAGLARWHHLARQRRALRALSDDLLKDIGISRADAEREAGRPFWSEGTGSRSGLRR